MAVYQDRLFKQMQACLLLMYKFVITVGNY